MQNPASVSRTIQLLPGANATERRTIASSRMRRIHPAAAVRSRSRFHGPIRKPITIPSSMLRRVGSATPLILVLLIATYGTLLRFEVFVARYGTLERPLWARVLTHDLAPAVKSLRPAPYGWYHIDQPYLGGDPINYLKFAREMKSFYQAHVREPVFLALTRVFLWLLSDQDAAVSFASATGSILTIFAVYLLGTVMLSRAAGLAAAAIVAIESALISWSVDGWRDDVFMATVPFSAWALVRCRRDPSIKNGALAGIPTAVACLTRITALSFVLPAFTWLIVDGSHDTRRPRAKAAGVAAVVCALLVGPYLVSCAIVTGDPFYAIDYHTGYYRYGEGVPSDKPMSALSYVSAKVRRRPVAALDTAITGLFVQPFTIKWRGLDGWLPGLATMLAWFSILGLARWVLLPEGRIMLVVLIGSLVPYALTWNVAGGGEWRFTMHAYPLYLVASISGVALSARAVMMLWKRQWRIRERISKRLVVRWVAAMVAILGVSAAYIALPWFVVREGIAARTDVSVETGGRDATFFGAGWSGPYADGPTFRVSRAEHAVVRIPLPERRPYQIVLRLD